MKNQRPLFGKKAIVCGGSKGIGKETAKEILRLGGSVSIVARGKDGLREAEKEMQQIPLEENQFIETIACDTTDYEALKPHFERFVVGHGLPDFLLNCVGYAYPNYVQEYTLDDFQQNMNANFYGQLVPTLILLPHFGSSLIFFPKHPPAHGFISLTRPGRVLCIKTGRPRYWVYIISPMTVRIIAREAITVVISTGRPGTILPLPREGIWQTPGVVIPMRPAVLRPTSHRHSTIVSARRTGITPII